jgi:hypothetical protein
MRAMNRLLSIPLFLLACLSTFAQAAAEAPVEKANPLVVVGFLVLFVGGCAGYFIYLMWAKNKEAKDK